MPLISISQETFDKVETEYKTFFTTVSSQKRTSLDEYIEGILIQGLSQEETRERK